MTCDVATVERAWPRILDQLENPEIERAVKTWLRPAKVKPLHVEDETLLIECPTVLYVQQINKRLATLLLLEIELLLQYSNSIHVDLMVLLKVIRFRIM